MYICRFVLLSCLLAVSFAAVAQAPAGPVVDPQPLLDQGAVAEFVFEDDRPFKQCHASSIVQTASGDLIAVWFAGTRESDPDVGIWMSRREAGKWSAPVVAAKVNETAHWNPVLFRDASGGIHLFFKVGPEIPSWQTYWISSTDDGRTWSAAKELVPGDDGGRGPVRNKPILLSDGSWLSGASTEKGAWIAFADRSEDKGATWTRGNGWAVSLVQIPGKGVIQPTLWESAPGQVHALVRSTGGVIGRADSPDGGHSWTQVMPTSMPNNNSGIDLVRLSDGRLLLVYNPVAANWGSRSPLNLALSTDNGVTWRDIASLESEPKMEFSYPAIVTTSEGVAISYTWKRQRVRVWTIPASAIPAQ